MWLLEDQNGKFRYFKPEKIYNVGRKQADIVLENDSSISRTHAKVAVTLKEQTRTTDVSSTCIVKDVGSKYGTFIIRNNVQMKVPANGLELEPGDSVKFGLQQHIFKAKYTRFVSVISRINVEHKKKLKDIMDCIGGIVIDCYDDNCTHLTATTATSTSKLISALIAGIPIVDISYWISVLKAINADENLPDPNLFTLPLQDKGINSQRVSLKPNSVRKTLFQGKTFIVFSEKTYKEYKKMIKSAGGKIEIFKINAGSNPDELLVDDFIIMQITSESMNEEFASFEEKLYNKMQTKKLRMISETEIPLAIIYVSLKQYCNPKFNFKQLMLRKNIKEDTSEVLALDTQDVLMTNLKSNSTEKSTMMRKVFIPETQLDTQNVSTTNLKNNSSEKITTMKKAFIPETQDSEFGNTPENENSPISGSLAMGSKDKSFSRPTISKVCNMDVDENLNHREKTKMSTDKRVNEKHSGNLAVKKTKSVVEIPTDGFAVLEKQKKIIQIKEDVDDRKENNLMKLGFKRSERKTVDFDIDDVEMEKPKEKIKKEIPTQETKEEIKQAIEMNNKRFKKIYKNIPVMRVALTNMTMWIPNN